MRSIMLAVKRFFDILLSGLTLLLTFPILILSVIGILLTMPGPIFFVQERVGKGKKTFWVIKLRTMKVDRDLEKSHDMNHDADRITKFGTILRRLKIDELPQLINVFIGDMSLVGPRPTVIDQTMMYTKRESRRLEMRPGMTGLAQINGNALLAWEDRFEYDIMYIDTFSVWLDIKILIKTILVVFNGEEKYLHRLSNLTVEESRFYTGERK